MPRNAACHAVDATTNRSKGVLWFWNLDDDKPFHTFKLTGGGRALDLTPDGRQAAVAQTDRKLQIVQFTAKTA